jgi:hypothetical protein
MCSPVLELTKTQGGDEGDPLSESIREGDMR